MDFTYFLPWKYAGFVIEGPHGWLDLLAGFRYTYLGEQVGLQANNLAINAASTQLVNQFAQSLTTPGSDPLKAMSAVSESDQTWLCRSTLH